MNNRNILLSVGLLMAVFLSLGLVSATPTILSIVPADATTDTGSSLVFTATINETSSTPTDGSALVTCTLDFSQTNPGSPQYTMTATNTTPADWTCTQTLTYIPENIYHFTITSSNSTTASDQTSASRTLTIDDGQNGNNGGSTGGTDDTGTGDSGIGTEIIILIVLLAVGYYIINK